MGLSLRDPGLHSHRQDTWLASMQCHQLWWLFPLPRALEKMCPLDAMLEAMPSGELPATDAEPAVPWLRARAGLSLSLPDTVLQMREVALNERALHLKANVQSLHHQDRPGVLGFFVVVIPAPPS